MLHIRCVALDVIIFIILFYFFEFGSDDDQQNAETFQRMRVVCAQERIDDIHYGFEQFTPHEQLAHKPVKRREQ